MPRGSIIFVAGCILLASCGQEEGARTPAPAAAPAPETVCPVEGTRFPAGSGVPVEILGRRIEVCSGGCAYVLGLEPARYLKDGDGR